MKECLKKQKGFSLFEMVITLVVVGILVLGGVKGYELYTNAKLYQLKSEFEDFEGVINTYYLKHAEMPGKMTNSNFSSTKFWQDLRVEGLIDGDVTDGNPPRHAFGSFDTVWLAHQVGGNPFSNGLFVNALLLCATKVNAVHAQAIDKKFDDGNSKTGRIKSVKQDRFLNPDGTVRAALWWRLKNDKLINYDDNPSQEWYVAVCQKVARWR